MVQTHNKILESKAAQDLAAIQAKAGRRVGARVWATEAERILAKQETA